MRVGVRAPQIYALKKGSIRNVAVDCSGFMETAEVMTGTPTLTVTVDGVLNTALVFSSIAVSVATLTINGTNAGAGKAVQFSVNTSAAVVGTRYVISVSAGTNSTPAETLKGEVVIDIVA